MTDRTEYFVIFIWISDIMLSSCNRPFLNKCIIYIQLQLYVITYLQLTEMWHPSSPISCVFSLFTFLCHACKKWQQFTHLRNKFNAQERNKAGTFLEYILDFSVNMTQFLTYKKKLLFLKK